MTDDSTPFDPGVYRDRRYRAGLIASGRLIPLDARPTLRLDARGRAVTRRHIEQGDEGRQVLAVPPGYFELPAWQVRALEARERRVKSFNAFLKRVWPPPDVAIALERIRQASRLVTMASR